MKEKTYQGKVIRKVFAKGAKSEHDAVMLVTENNQLLKLRRLGANPFQDEALEQLVGMEIRCTGTARGSTLLVNDWEEAETPESWTAQQNKNTREEQTGIQRPVQEIRGRQKNHVQKTGPLVKTRFVADQQQL